MSAEAQVLITLHSCVTFSFLGPVSTSRLFVSTSVLSMRSGPVSSHAAASRKTLHPAFFRALFCFCEAALSARSWTGFCFVRRENELAMEECSPWETDSYLWWKMECRTLDVAASECLTLTSIGRSFTSLYGCLKERWSSFRQDRESSGWSGRNDVNNVHQTNINKPFMPSD